MVSHSFSVSLVLWDNVSKLYGVVEGSGQCKVEVKSSFEYSVEQYGDAGCFVLSVVQYGDAGRFVLSSVFFTNDGICGNSSLIGATFVDILGCILVCDSFCKKKKRNEHLNIS